MLEIKLVRTYDFSRPFTAWSKQLLDKKTHLHSLRYIGVKIHKIVECTVGKDTRKD